ncbi:MAG: ATP-binding protein [Spirochaetaceae bacterium]|jgi:predicted AAA+ superfamily ATPase|nr:ATP-binding protein [Spirochaetaceae bacterium]
MDNVRAMCAETLNCLAGLSLFGGIRSSPIIKALERLMSLIEGAQAAPRQFIEGWAAFLNVFAQHNKNRTFFMYLTDLIISDENIFTLNAERGEFNNVSLLAEIARNDLKRLAVIGDFDIPMAALHITDELWQAGFEDLARVIENSVRTIGELKAKNYTLPQKTFPYGLLNTQDLTELCAHIKKHGAGSLAQHHFFYWKQGEGLVPAYNPDPVRLAGLSGYEDQRNTVIENTARFLAGNGANNVLLYGDRGTGKSATVKAVCNEYKNQGIRLVEVRKQDLSEIPVILSTLAQRGLFFVLFIDDLSFEHQNDDFTLLKALLEGGIEAKPHNVVVYATSNRRHFVREQFSDRPGITAASDDVRAFDTMQEQLSLADRFGITLVFSAPSQDEFIRIAEFLAEERQLFTGSGVDRQKFRENAIRWERWFNGRSPRTAQQYVEWAAGGEGFPWE